jgi:methionyl-tRNA synthetase
MTVTFKDFQELNIKIATVLEVADHPDADNLYLLKIDLGDEESRQLVAGLKNHYEPDQLTGKQIVVVTNLEQAKIRGQVSEGMLLAADAGTDVSLLVPDGDVPAGTPVR